MAGDLYVVSGPSGAGKGTLLAQVIPKLDNVWLSVSATTRAPRTGEKDGDHYFFIENEEFDRLISVGGMLEWAFVHGERYGTISSEVEGRLAAGIDVILEIDPQGAFQVLEKIPEAILIFIEPPTLEALEHRLRGRGTEDDAEIRRRMDDAVEEMKYRDRYQHILVNDNLKKAAKELLELLKE